MEPLEQRGAIRFLLYLLRKKQKVAISDALQDLNVGQSALYTAIDKLAKANLIKENKDSNFPFPRTFSLSDKGERIAKKLEEIESYF